MLPLALRQSFNLMLTGRPGPVNLDVPFNLFQEEDEVTLLPSDRQAGFARPGAAPEDVRRLVDMILAAERPAFFVSHGVTLAEAGPELTRVAELLNIPVITSPNGMGVALAPIASSSATHRSDCCTRTFSPFMSASAFTGFFTVYIERAPLS